MPIPAASRSPQLRYYYERRRPANVGQQGGARPCKPGCTCRRHRAAGIVVMPRVEVEGSVTRIECVPCGRRIAGVFTDNEIAALVEVHRHRRRDRVRGEQVRMP